MQESSSLYPLIGILASTIALIGIVVRYFVKSMERKDTDHKELTQKFIDLTEEMLDAKGKQMGVLLQVVALLERHTPILEKLIPILERHGEILAQLSQQDIATHTGQRKPVPRR
jgi:hypothetical protein